MLGEDLAAPALAVAERVAGSGRVDRAPASAGRRDRAIRARRFQRRNFALARAAAEAYLQTRGIPLSEGAVAQAAAATEVRGRLQVLERDPPTVLDGRTTPTRSPRS